MKKNTKIILILGASILTIACIYLLLDTNRSSTFISSSNHRIPTNTPTLKPSPLPLIQETISPFLDGLVYKEVRQNEWWNVFDDKKEVGFVSLCDIKYSLIECSSLVPQTYIPTGYSASYELKNMAIYKKIYNVLKSAAPADSETIIYQSAVFVFSKQDLSEKIVFVIEDTTSEYYTKMIVKLSGYEKQLNEEILKNNGR